MCPFVFGDARGGAVVERLLIAGRVALLWLRRVVHAEGAVVRAGVAEGASSPGPSSSRSSDAGVSSVGAEGEVDVVAEVLVVGVVGVVEVLLLVVLVVVVLDEVLSLSSCHGW